MKTITIRELHEKTGRWVRGVWRHGEIRVTDNGQTVAKLVPDTDPALNSLFRAPEDFSRVQEIGTKRQDWQGN